MEPAVGVPQIFPSGRNVPETGIYLALHPGERCSQSEFVLMREHAFPSCATCGDAVEFRLLRAAPYIGEDADFAESVATAGIGRRRDTRFARAKAARASGCRGAMAV
jgi:hypothetical protein